MFDYETFVEFGQVHAWVSQQDDETGEDMIDVEFAIYHEPGERTGHGPDGDHVHVEGVWVYEFGRAYFFDMDEAFGEIADEVAEAVEIEYRGQEVEYDG